MKTHHEQLKKFYKRTCVISMFFYLMAIGLALIESFIIDKDMSLNFFSIFAFPMFYLLYYINIAIQVKEDCKYSTPSLVIISVSILCSVFITAIGNADNKEQLICVILQVSLAIIEIITAIIVNFKSSKM